MKTARITRRCPFCYAPPREIQVTVYRHQNHYKIACQCIPCGARGPESLARHNTKAEAIFDWNRKATIKDWTRTDYQKDRNQYARTHA